MLKIFCARFCVGFMIFAELTGGLALLVYIFHSLESNEGRNESNTIFFVILVIMTLSAILSGLLLLVGAIWGQSKHVLAHLIINVIIYIGIFTLIILAFSLDYESDLKIQLGGFGIFAVPLSIACFLEYGIYLFYKKMINNYQKTQSADKYELEVLDE